MASPRANVLEHKSLQCSIRGVRSSWTSTTQFRGLKYAHTPARYQASILNEVLCPGSDGIVDATSFGPSCPQVRGAQSWDLTLVGNVNQPGSSRDEEEEEWEEEERGQETMNEFDCLHLNITVPMEGSPSNLGTAPTRQLPVFVWVHGGGLSVGSNSWPQYDVTEFVDRSVQIGKPVVGVAINYRIGVFGFLASEEIGAAGNMGFKDQVLAFMWIKHHIAGFGGDLGNVTAVGESAGAISLSTLLCANVGKEGLFERVILMSGETTLRKPRIRTWQQEMYEQQSVHLKLDPKDVVGRRNALLDTPAEELAQKLPLAQHFTGTIDGEWLKSDVDIEILSEGRRPEHKPPWCKDLVVGDSAHDGTILKTRILDRPQTLAHVKEACANHLSPAETTNLLRAYNLDKVKSTQQEADQLRELVSELRFYLPALAVHRGWKNCVIPHRQTARYNFHVENPFQGSFTSLASHELDVAYLLQNFNDQLDEKNRRLAQGMADHFIRFTNGGGWAEEGKVVVFDRDGVVEVDEADYDGLYRSGRGAVLEKIGRLKLWHVAEMWQGVRREEPIAEGTAQGH